LDDCFWTQLFEYDLKYDGFSANSPGRPFGEGIAIGAGMDQIALQRMADSVLREYGVPMKVAGISHANPGWTIAFAGTFPGARAVEVKLQCERTSAYHVRESLKRGLALTD
jgi:hypothetical protein